MRVSPLTCAFFVILGVLACSVDDRQVVCEDCGGATERGGSSSGKGGASGGKGGAPSTSGGSDTGEGGDIGEGGAPSTTGGTGPVGKGGTSAGGNAPTSGGRANTGGTAGRGGGGPALSGGAPPGGAPGTGGATTPTCRATIAPGNNPQIDNFDDGELNILQLETRNGTWIHLRSDLPNTPLPPEVLEHSPGNGVMGFEGPGMQPVGTAYPWAHVQTLLYNVSTPTVSKSCVYNASAYDGIYFQATGTVNIRISVEMDLNVPTTNTWGAPGACTAAVESDCYNRHGQDILLDSTTVREYYVLWSDLRQQAFGTWRPAFTPARLHAIYFEILPDNAGAVPDYAVLLDEVSFIPAGVVPPPPAPTP